jgi:hypothetical protein
MFHSLVQKHRGKVYSYLVGQEFTVVMFITVLQVALDCLPCQLNPAAIFTPMSETPISILLSFHLCHSAKKSPHEVS